MNAVEIRKILTRLCSQIESQSHGMSEPPRNTSVSKKPRLEDTPLEAVPLPVTSSIQAKLLSYWISRKEDKFWDVYLVFDDGAQLLCSRRDLCLMSEYFGKMFEGEFAESAERKVPIKEVESSVMDKLVHSFYSGKVSIPFPCVTLAAWRLGLLFKALQLCRFFVLRSTAFSEVWQYHEMKSPFLEVLVHAGDAE